MNLPEGTHPIYTLVHEAWYARAQSPSGTETGREIVVTAATAEDGCVWEFMITEHDLRGPALRVGVFDDAWDAFTQMPELFTALAELGPRVTLDQVVALLNRLGFTDRTPRDNPYRNTEATAPPMVTHDRAYSVAADALGLFLEYRDIHGYGEEDTRAQAINEVREGLGQPADEARN